MKLLEELAQPAHLSHLITSLATLILNLSTGAGDHMLPLGGPRDKAARNRPTGVRALDPVSVGVGVDNQLV